MDKNLVEKWDKLSYQPGAAFLPSRVLLLEYGIRFSDISMHLCYILSLVRMVRHRCSVQSPKDMLERLRCGVPKVICGDEVEDELLIVIHTPVN